MTGPPTAVCPGEANPHNENPRPPTAITTAAATRLNIVRLLRSSARHIRMAAGSLMVNHLQCVSQWTARTFGVREWPVKHSRRHRAASAAPDQQRYIGERKWIASCRTRASQRHGVRQALGTDPGTCPIQGRIASRGRAGVGWRWSPRLKSGLESAADARYRRAPAWRSSATARPTLTDMVTIDMSDISSIGAHLHAPVVPPAAPHGYTSNDA